MLRRRELGSVRELSATSEEGGGLYADDCECGCWIVRLLGVLSELPMDILVSIEVWSLGRCRYISCDVSASP